MTQDIALPAPVTIDEARLARLRQKAELTRTITTWAPAPGDSIEGAIVGSRKAQGPFGPQVQMLVQRPDGSVVAIWLTAWLSERLRAEDAEIGSLVALTFHGQETSKTGKRYNRMTVVVG